MDAAHLQPRDEDGEGSPPAFPHTYRISVEQSDGSTHEHQFTTAGQHLEIGDVIKAGREGWSGPTVAIEEIDRHPDMNQAGAALAWPMSTGVSQGYRTLPVKP
jgi:hypothetical protein